MKIAIRVDASRAIGTGHVRRCLALAWALSDLGAEVRFVTRNVGLDTEALVTAAGFDCATLPAPADPPPASGVPHAAWAQVSGADDAHQTEVALGPWVPDWCVIDHYGFDAAWGEAARTVFACRIAVIDDLADRALAADVVVDHNFAPDHRAKYAGLIEPDAVLLGGPRFALLGPAFADGPRCEIADAVASVGVFLGGVDAKNLSSVALAALDCVGFAGAIEVVSTSANPHLAALRDEVAGRPRAVLAIDLPDLAQFFACHGLQIGAGGGATWERCCVGAPSMLLVTADNQLAVIPALARIGAITTPEPLDATAPGAMTSVLTALLANPERRRSLSDRSRALVDGRGARRVALHLLAGTMTVRPATHEDAALLHLWRDDPATRAVSRNHDPIAWEEHCVWLGRTLADPARTLLVGLIGDVPVGAIRFDQADDASAEVSLYLDPAIHGLGLGRALLVAGERAAANVLDFHAEVLEGNASSARLFESTGYRRIDATHWHKAAIGREQAD